MWRVNWKTGKQSASLYVKAWKDGECLHPLKLYDNLNIWGQKMKLYKVSYRVGNMSKGDYQYLMANSVGDAMKKKSLHPSLFDWEKPFLRWDCEIAK